MPTIRRIRIGEADLYRQVRLESLKESPQAFTTTYESALSRKSESWTAQADNSAIGRNEAIFLVLDDEPVGLAAVYRRDPESSVAELMQVWISPAYRGSSVVPELMNTIFQWASSHGIAELRAEITPQNFRALRFYEKCGFTQTSSDRGNIAIEKRV